MAFHPGIVTGAFHPPAHCVAHSVAVRPHISSLLRLPSQAGDILAAEDVQPEEIRRSSSAGSASQVSEGRVPVLRTLEAVPIMPSTVGCPLASHSLPSLPIATALTTEVPPPSPLALPAAAAPRHACLASLRPPHQRL